MEDLIELHRLGGDEFARQVDRIGATQWGQPTPCDEWNVRQLVEHVVGFNFFVPWLLDGHTVDDAPVADDLLGTTPGETARQSVKEAQTAFERPGVLSTIVHHPVGDVPASLFLVFRIFDFVVHGWDLAASMGAAFESDPRLLSAALAQARELEQAMAASGMFAPPLPISVGDTPLSEILARSGRRQSWQASD